MFILIHNNIRHTIYRRLVRRAQHTLIKDIIPIQKSEILALRFLHSLISGVRRTTAHIIIQNFNPTVFCPETLCYFQRVIRGGIIDANQLKICKSLRHNTVQTFLQIFFRIVKRHNNRYLTHNPGTPIPSDR